MASIETIKQTNGAKRYASVLGKSTIASDSPEYRMIEEATRTLFAHGYGIIHGGYLGGAMSAASDTANALIKEKGLAKSWNIGVPQAEHDGLWERVIDAEFTEPATHIYQRLEIVTAGDIAVICPLGGDGTELEAQIIFHENVIRDGLKEYDRPGKKPTPLIFLQTVNGTPWKLILEAKMKNLDTSVKSFENCPWLYFADSIQEFEAIIKSLDAI